MVWDIILTRTRTCHACDGPLPQVHSFIDSFIFWTVPLEKYCSLWAKNLKIFSDVVLMEAHHMSKTRVCIYLSYLTIKAIVVRIWYVFSNIHQGLRENRKIMKKIDKLAERNTNNHKYRLFPISSYLSCKGQPTLWQNRICLSYNFFRFDQIEPNKDQQTCKEFKILIT